MEYAACWWHVAKGNNYYGCISEAERTAKSPLLKRFKPCLQFRFGDLQRLARLLQIA